MKSLRALAVALPCLALVAACAGPSTFLLGKNGDYEYFGKDRPYLRKLLCKQGELEAVLSSAALPADRKKDFQRYICSDERSYDKVISLYLFLSPEEKRSLKKAFEQQGYEVNRMPC